MLCVWVINLKLKPHGSPVALHTAAKICLGGGLLLIHMTDSHELS